MLERQACSRGGQGDETGLMGSDVGRKALGSANATWASVDAIETRPQKPDSRLRNIFSVLLSGLFTYIRSLSLEHQAEPNLETNQGGVLLRCPLHFQLEGCAVLQFCSRYRYVAVQCVLKIAG